jgi:N utilization substance protein A
MMAPKKRNKKKRTTVRKAAGRKPVRKKKKPKAKTPVPKTAPRKKVAPRRARGESERESSLTFEPAGLGARSGGQSGDLQGLSDRGGADSESVDELLEEGNAFEAEAVKGVQDAPDADEGEVRTHEVPEDDVPDEYKDNEP